MWLLNVVAKQDLWWPERVDVENYYLTGPYHVAVKEGLAARDPANTRVETVFTSLVISNFRTAGGERLVSNAAGYDQMIQASSLHRLISVVNELREWGDDNER